VITALRRQLSRSSDVVHPEVRSRRLSDRSASEMRDWYCRVLDAHVVDEDNTL
jgi:hypothetical protein